jgi:membrane protein
VGFLERSVILAGQAFSAILPLVMVLSTISPQSGGDSPTAIQGRRLGLKPSDVASLQAAIAPPPSARASIGGLGVLLTLLTATSFARALHRSYELAWRLPPVGLRAAWRPLALVIGLALYVELLFLFGRLWPPSSVPSWPRIPAALAGSSAPQALMRMTAVRRSISAVRARRG